MAATKWGECGGMSYEPNITYVLRNTQRVYVILSTVLYEYSNITTHEYDYVHIIYYDICTYILVDS